MIANIDIFEINQFCSLTQLSLLGDWKSGDLIFVNPVSHLETILSPKDIRNKLKNHQEFARV